MASCLDCGKRLRDCRCDTASLRRDLDAAREDAKAATAAAIRLAEELEESDAYLEDARRERDAYKRAKAENDERFMIERDESRAREAGLRAALEAYLDSHVDRREDGARECRCPDCEQARSALYPAPRSEPEPAKCPKCGADAKIVTGGGLACGACATVWQRKPEPAKCEDPSKCRCCGEPADARICQACEWSEVEEAREEVAAHYAAQMPKPKEDPDAPF